MSVGQSGMAGGTPATAPRDPSALLRSRGYLKLLVLAALLGVPVCAVAFGFLAVVQELQSLVQHDLPRALGFAGAPVWWPLPVLAVGGLLTAVVIRYLPGNGGHEPADGFAVGGAPAVSALPGIALAALASLGSGAVLGPEAPLIALGGGLAVGVVRLLQRDLTDQAAGVVGAAGSFAAVSALLGSPLLGAFLLMEASGLGGAVLGAVLVPGLLAAGIGALIFTGLGDWSGLGTYALTVHGVPKATDPSLPEFGWALAIGVGAALLGFGVRRLAVLLKNRVVPHRLPATVAMALVVGALAIAFSEATGKPVAEVLNSGQSALGTLFEDSTGYSAAALVLLVACKSLAYCASLSSFRGGPIFPAMFLGAAGGMALSQLPGLTATAAFAMGIGAMTVAMFRLPMTAVLLATLLLGRPGLTVMPLVIVAVVVAYVLTARLTPVSGTAPRSGAAVAGEGTRP
ncbi:chloride channel protein [Streptomyces sp. NPDC048638]|uniref:chloride channel protein n=1 Tax=Streptomyces sp. NPDC048638 TaxID=3365580 RepID=UPI003716FAE2